MGVTLLWTRIGGVEMLLVAFHATEIGVSSGLMGPLGSHADLTYLLALHRYSYDSHYTTVEIRAPATWKEQNISSGFHLSVKTEVI